MSSPFADRRSRVDVLGELGRVARAHAQRLEHAVAQLEAAIEGRQVRAVGRAAGGRRPRRCPRGRRVPCPVTVRPPPPPMAASGPRALTTVSSHSAAGSLFQVIPPPTCRVSRRPSATKVRIRMLVCIAPSGPIQPSAPVYGPRRTGSRPSRISIARILGAPVIDPPGNDAARRSNASRPSSSSPVTVETRCWTAAVRSRRQRRGTRTLPGRQTRPRSLRSTSTIMTFSARSLALARSSRASARSSAMSRPRGRVPLIGSALTWPRCVDRQERLGRGRQQRPGTAGQLARAEVEEGREQRRVAGPEAAVQLPRVGVERASRGGGSGWPGRCRRGRCARGRARPRSCRHACDRGSIGTRAGIAAPPGTVARPRWRRRVAVAASPSKAPIPAAAATRSAGRGRRRAGGRAGARHRRGRDPRARRGPSVDPRPRPSRGARGAGAAGPGPPARSTAGARARRRGRSRGSRPARRGTAARRPGRSRSGRGGRRAGAPRRTGPGRPRATRGPPRDRRSGRSTGRSGPAGRSRAGTDPGGPGRPRPGRSARDVAIESRSRRSRTGPLLRAEGITAG